MRWTNQRDGKPLTHRNTAAVPIGSVLAVIAVLPPSHNTMRRYINKNILEPCVKRGWVVPTSNDCDSCRHVTWPEFRAPAGPYGSGGCEAQDLSFSQRIMFGIDALYAECATCHFLETVM